MGKFHSHLLFLCKASLKYYNLTLTEKYLPLYTFFLSYFLDNFTNEAVYRHTQTDRQKKNSDVQIWIDKNT